MAIPSKIPRIKAAGGNAQMLYPPDDKNNLQIADMILEWIDKNVGETKLASK